MRRALLLAALALAAAGRLAAQEPVPPPAPRPDTVRTDTLTRDTLRTDSLRLDSLRLDSLRLDSLRTDSLRADSLRADSAAHADSAAAPQATPHEAPWHDRVQPGFRRSPTLAFDPFRYALVTHWGFVLNTGVSGVNNSFDFQDVGAVMFLQKKDSLTAGTALDAMGLVPAGKGLVGALQGGTSFHLGGPFGRHLALGLSVGGRAYSSFHLDDDFVAFLRDGNGARQNFSVGTSGGAALATAEAGAHAVVRFGPRAGEAGLHITAGVGVRYLRPLAYARGGSSLPGGGTIRVTGDSVALNAAVQSDFTYQSEKKPLDVKGSGIATDWLLRFDLPRPGVAFEVSLTNVGSVKIQGVERRRATIPNVQAASLNELRDILMTHDSVTTGPGCSVGAPCVGSGWTLKSQYRFKVLDTTAVTVTLPRVLRLAASAWVLPMLQVDASYSGAVSGDFAAPAMLEAGATLRLLRWFPLRVGVIHEGDYGTGFSGGVGLETRVLYLDITGATLGGGFKTGKGGGARVELGFFF